MYSNKYIGFVGSPKEKPRKNRNLLINTYILLIILGFIRPQHRFQR